MNNKKLPLPIRLGYGSTGVGAILVFSLFVGFGMYFFTDVVGFNPAFAGVLMSIGTLWDAITDPLVGRWSDGRNPKKGRRRPFLLWVAIPFGIVSWLLFTDFGFEGTANKVYFIIIVLAFWTVQTLLDVPYTALGAEMITDYNERMSLNSTRMMFAVVGSIIYCAALIIIDFFMNKFDISWTAGWSYTGLLFGVISTITILIGWTSTKGRELEDVEVEKISFIDMFRIPLKNKVFLITVGMFAFAIMAQTLDVAVCLYYAFYVINITDAQYTIFLFATFGSGLAWVPVADLIANKISKKASWIIMMALWGISFPMFVFFILKPDMVTIGQLIAWGILSGSGYNAVYQLAWAMIPDSVEVDELVSGKRREGMYYGLMTFIQKVSAAIVLFGAGLFLEYIGYVPYETQAPDILEKLRIFQGLSPSIVLAISIIFAIVNPMTRAKHKELLDIIKAKNEGKSFNIDNINSLFSKAHLEEIEKLNKCI